MTNMLNTIRKASAIFAVFGIATFMLAACGGGGGGGNGGGGGDMGIEPRPNRAPQTRASIPDQTLRVGGTVTIDLSRYFMDPDGDRLTYSLTYSDGQANNVRASVSGDSLRIQGVASPGAVVRVTARDPSGSQVHQDFRAQVSADDGDNGDDGDDDNRAPRTRGSIPDQTLRVGGTVTIDLSRYFTDPDGDRLTYSLTYSDGQANNVRASVSGDSLRIQGVASPGAVVRVIARDPSGSQVHQDVRVTVSSPSYGAYAYQLRSAGGYAWSLVGGRNSAEEALTAARNGCARLAGSRCQTSRSFSNSCAAIALSRCRVSSCEGQVALGHAYGYSSRSEAETAAIAHCNSEASGIPGLAGTCDVDTDNTGAPGSVCTGVE